MASSDYSSARTDAGSAPVSVVWAYALLALVPVGFVLGLASASQPGLSLIYVCAYTAIVVLDAKAIKKAGRSIGVVAPIFCFWLPPIYFFLRARALRSSYLLFSISLVVLALPIAALAVLSVY